MAGQHRVDGSELVRALRQWASALGFSQIGVAGIDLSTAEEGLQRWLEAGFHGAMGYMARHGATRARPAELVPGTASVISARMDYLTRDAPDEWRARESARLGRPDEAVISLYARGRDYHKVLRGRLQRLADRLAAEVGPFGHRVFADSAPVLEVELATRAGLGWRGKHTLALARDAGSMFFLGELFVDLDLPPDRPLAAHCGRCTACLDVCPTRAIVAPYRLDARRCVSYLTIEHPGPIPVALRALVGNRIFGCDDCQWICPWNKYARRAVLADFDARPGMSGAALLELWQWDEASFLARTAGSAIRRIGWSRWRRNLALALGNARRTALAGGAAADGQCGADRWGAELAQAVVAALASARDGADALVREHIDWALAADPAG